MGISQPAKGTKRAPRARCLAYRGARFIGSSLTPPEYRDPGSGTRQEPLPPRPRRFLRETHGRPAASRKPVVNFGVSAGAMLTFARGKRPNFDHRARRVGVEPARQVPR